MRPARTHRNGRIHRNGRTQHNGRSGGSPRRSPPPATLRLGGNILAAVVAGALFGVLPAAHAGEVRLDQRAPSISLGRPMGYAIYLPDAALDPAVRAGVDRLPVVYLLHGYGARGLDWVNGARIADLLDDEIAAGRLEPVIAVMPDAGNSWYVDSAAHGGPGDVASAILTDLLPHVEETYPASSDRADRAIVGFSMGGFGALNLAFRHPELFSAVVAIAPAIFDPGGLSWERGQLADTQDELDRWYPKTFGSSFDPAIYRANEPFAAIAHLAAHPDPPAVMLIAGDRDFFNLHLGTIDMYMALEAADLDAALRIYDGDHSWTFVASTIGEALAFIDRARSAGR